MASLTHDDVENLAQQNGLGEVTFETRRAANTGRLFEVGMVGDRVLFAKRHSGTKLFHLCNEYRSLAPNNGEGPLV